MLTVYRRHGKECGQQSRRYRRCNCPCWCEGTTERGEYLRQSLKARSWDVAVKAAKDLELGHRAKVTVGEAIDGFIQDARSRSLQQSTIEIYQRLLNRLKAFADSEGVTFIKDCDLEFLRRFRSTLPHQNFSARNKTEMLRSFFRFIHENKWAAENPATHKTFKSPKTRLVPTLPYTREEFSAILKACDEYRNLNTGKVNRNAAMLKAFVLVLRHSGLRIRDVVTLKQERIGDGKLFLYTSKAGTPVKLPLPTDCLDALKAIPHKGSYYFWSGEGKPKTRVGNFQAMLKQVYILANISGGHAHRFRDTFAVELLMVGVPTERVAILLGNTPKIVERHYSPWIQARQEQLEADVRRTWEQASA